MCGAVMRPNRTTSYPVDPLLHDLPDRERPLLDLDLQRVEPLVLTRVRDIRCATGPSERAGVTDLSTALPIKGWSAAPPQRLNRS